jgi:CheY-like chemotaxis protein
MILIAEDNPVLRDVLVKQLEKLGYKAITVPCGGKAVEEALRSPVNLILMDIQMPNVDGLEATKRIRQIEESEGREHIPIVAVTAEATRQSCLAAGMDDYYQKPLLMDQLKDVISKWRRKAG